MATGQEPGGTANTFKGFTHVMWLTTNVPPPAPQLSTPYHQSTPHDPNITFSVLPVSDPDGDGVKYRFVGSAAPGCGNDRFDSGEEWWSNQWTWASPQQFDNTTTYWCAYTRDGWHPWRRHQWFDNGAEVKVVNGSAPVTLVSPADNSLRVTDTPTLTATVGADPDGDAMSFRFVLTPADGVGVQAASEWRNGPATNSSWTVPAGLLDPLGGQPLTTYRWGVEVTDTRLSTTPMWRTMRAEPYLGTGTVAPMQQVGPVAVNLATGNLAFSTASPAVTTVSGPVGVSYAFNSQDRTNLGLRGTYYNDANNNTVIDAGEQIYLARRDAIPSFNWALGSPSPSVPVDNFSAVWKGFMTAPATGSWQFRITHDDAVKVFIDDTQVYDAAFCCGTFHTATFAMTAGTQKPIEIRYREGIGTGYIQIQAIRDGISLALDPAWFTTRSMPLPLGWTMTGITGDGVEYAEARVSETGVLLTRPDGTQELFAKTGGGGYDPPTGSDDTVTVNTTTGTVTVLTAGGVEQQFDAHGAMTAARTVIDDRSPAATSRTHANAADGTPRLRTVADPGRGGATILTLDYQGGPGSCPAPPPGGHPVPDGMLCRLTYVDGSVTELRYTSGQLTTILDPGGERTDIAYDAQQQISEIRDPLVNDWLTSSAYDGSPQAQYATTITSTAGKVTAVTQPAPAPAAARPGVTIAYGGGTTSVTQAGLSGGPHRVAAFDTAGRMTSDTDAVGRISSIVLDNQDRVTSNDSGGRRTTNIYNDRNQLTDTYGPAPTSCFGTNNQPNGTCPGSVPHTSTAYDGGINGLAFAFWNNLDQTGAAAGHATQGGSGLSVSIWPGNPTAGVNADGFSFQATGLIDIPSAGDWEFRLQLDDGGALFIDDKLITSGMWWTTTTGTAQQLTVGNHRIRLQGSENGGPGGIGLEWRPAGGSWAAVPGSALSPNYGLRTRVTVDDSGGAAPSSVTDTRYTDGGLDPAYGLVTATVKDPAGLAHTESYTYEAPGGLLRRLSRTLAGGNTYSYNHYAAGATASACSVRSREGITFR